MVLISEKMNEALNGQIGKEIESGYIYLSASLWLKENSFKNLSNWFFIQYKEEIEHAHKFMDYIVDVGGHVTLPAINPPKGDWTSIKEILDTAYAHEQSMTESIRNLVILAEELKDYNPRELLQWFVTEQIEEEANAGELVAVHSGFNNDMLFDHHTSRSVTPV